MSARESTAASAWQPAVPGPRGLPGLGSLPAFRRDLPGLLLRTASEYGDRAELRLGARRLLFLNAPELVGAVLAAPPDIVDKPAGADPARALLLGRGLIISDGPEHQAQRRRCAPSFAPRRVDAHDTTIVAAADRAAERWPDGGRIDLGAEMNRLALDIAGRALLGADLLGEAADLRRALETARDFVQDRGRAPLRLPLGWPAPRHRRFRAAVARVDATLDRLIAARQAAGNPGTDLLGTLLAPEPGGSRLRARQVRDEALNLFWAGHEPAALALTAAGQLLVRHPAVYARLRAEVDHVLAGRPPAAADLPALAYTGQVFAEVLRLCPPIFAFGRRIGHDLALPGLELRAGAAVLISPLALHRRPETFPDPGRFDPDRFAPAAAAGRSRFAYLPFGYGPRVCLGAHFAILVGVLVLAALAQQVTFEPGPGRPVDPLMLIARPGRDRVEMIVRHRAAGARAAR